MKCIIVALSVIALISVNNISARDAIGIDESVIVNYPATVDAVPQFLRYPVGSTFTVDADGNYIVDGKIRYLLGAQGPKTYSDTDVKPSPGYPDALKWIYEQTLDHDSMQRLGLDSFAPFTSQSFITLYIPDHKKGLMTPSYWETLNKLINTGLPMYADFTAVPWDKGAFNHKDPQYAPFRHEDALNHFHQKGVNHWVPYNIFHPDGQRLYSDYWREGVKEMLRGNSPIVAYELFNEPAYDDTGNYNRGLFAKYLEERYGNVSAMNQIWGSDYADFTAASQFKTKVENHGLAVDWSKFLEAGFTELTRLGVETVRAVDPQARVSLQLLGSTNYRVIGKNYTNAYEFNKYLDTIAVSTGGGLTNAIHEVAAKDAIDTPANNPAVGEGILQRHFYRAIAEGKPLVNSELYILKKATDMRTRIWLDLLRGCNASYVFEWSKRAWDWGYPPTAEGGKRCAENEPYHLINPYNQAELWGIMQVKNEIFRLNNYFVPRQRVSDVDNDLDANLEADVAILFSYPNERPAEANGNITRHEIAGYAGALAFAHIQTDVILEEQLAERQSRYKVIVAAGIRNIYPQTAEYLINFVKNGGVLILAREYMLEDEYGHPVDWQGILDISVKRDETMPTAEIKFNIANSLHEPEILPGSMKGRNTRLLTLSPDRNIHATCQDQPALASKTIEKGAIYLLAPEMQDYAISKHLLSILGKHEVQPIVNLTRVDAGDLAVNVEIHVAKRDAGIMYFLVNHDKYPKLVKFQPALKTAAKSVAMIDPLRSIYFPVDNLATEICIPGYSYRVVGVGDLAKFTAEFGEFLAATTTEKDLYEQAKSDYESKLAEDHANQFRFTPDLTRTRTLDLRSVMNRGFIDTVAEDGQGGWTDQGRENSLTGVPWGVHNFRGVPCDLIRFDENENRTCLVMASTSQVAKLPEIVSDIRVGGQIRHLYFFHTAAWVGGRGSLALTYRIHYKSGQTLDVEARCSENIGNWWLSGMADYIAWSNRDRRGFYVMEWENPRPEDEVVALDIVSPNSQIVPIVLAITAEEYVPLQQTRWDKLTGHGWGKAKLEIVNPENNDEKVTCNVTIAPDTDDWAGFTCWVKDPTQAFSPTPQQWKQAELQFEINGGLDRFGNHKGEQKLYITLRNKKNGKELNSQRVILQRFISGYNVDNNPETWQKVTIPLREFKKTDDLQNTILGVGIQFNGTGKIAGVQVRDFCFVYP